MCQQKDTVLPCKGVMDIIQVYSFLTTATIIAGELRKNSILFGSHHCEYVISTCCIRHYHVQ